MRFVGRAAPGSAIVFDYWFRAVLDGDLRFHGARQAVARVRKMGEPYRSGIEPGGLPDYLAARHLELVSALGPADLQPRYLVRGDGRSHGTPYGFLGIAHARVPARGAGAGEDGRR